MTALKLFDMLIMPILRYCAEVWSPSYIQKLTSNNLLSLCEKCPIEKIHNKFCRFVLGVNKFSTNAGVKAEFGRRPLLINLLIHSIKYWFYLGDKNANSVVKNAYLDDYQSAQSHCWTSKIKLLLGTFSLMHVWESHGTKHKNKITHMLLQNLFSQHDNEWYSLISSNDSKLRTYCTFKSNYEFENYLLFGSTGKFREFCKFRISAHQLRIETGRYTKPHKTPLENRTCLLCDSGAIEDEKHFLLQCPTYSIERSTLFSTLNKFSLFEDLPENDKFTFLMTYNNGDMEILKLIVDFVDECMNKRNINLSAL